MKIGAILPRQKVVTKTVKKKSSFKNRYVLRYARNPENIASVILKTKFLNVYRVVVGTAMKIENKMRVYIVCCYNDIVMSFGECVRQCSFLENGQFSVVTKTDFGSTLKQVFTSTNTTAQLFFFYLINYFRVRINYNR